MGIESRDYIRDERPAFGFRGPASGNLWAVTFVLIANVAVFLLQNMTKHPLSPSGHIRGGLTEWLSLSLWDPQNPSQLQLIQLWRVVTYGFCHANFQHILFNMYVFWMFGRIIEPIYGSREFLCFYLGGIVISGLCHVGMQAVQPGMGGVVGASGGVMAVVFLTAAVYPRMTVLLMFVLPVQLRFIAIGYAAIDLLGALNPGASKVAHVAHLGGAAFGYAYKHFNWRFSGLLDSLSGRFKRKVPRSRAKVKLYRPTDPPPPQNLEREVDEILEKISKEGEASLTEKEREILAEASRQYRKR